MNDQNSKPEGIIFNIQRYTIHDGPGIRTEVFLKGCPLHCKWCSNPESMKLNPEIGVYPNRCIGIDKCGYCLAACPEPQKPIVIKDGIVAGITREACRNCGKCAQACPANALIVWGKSMKIPEVMKVILADMDFYKKSGGGVTLSGGEVLLQWEFALELLKECKRHNIHTCIESSLHYKAEVLERIFPYTDLIITDIKHMDSAYHKAFTGVGNELILGNIKKAVQAAKLLVIRIPIVPEHNSSEENIRATADYISKELNNKVIQVQLLPYRRLGTEKYESLGIGYPMDDYETIDRNVWEKNIIELVKIMKTYGVPAVAGTTSKIQTE